MTFKDQLDRTISIGVIPRRIISLVPSQTELLVDLGLEDRIVGVTKFCVHPQGIRKRKAIIGGTKNYHFDMIDQLNPDLIIGNKEENDQDGINLLMKKYPVWMSDIYSLEDSLEMIRQLGEIFKVEKEAKLISDRIQSDFPEKPLIRGRSVYLIWNNPIMAAGSKTFIDEMLLWAGFENLIKANRYPEVSKEELKQLNPDFLILSSEPFPFKERHLKEFEEFLPNAKIKIVDGELFSWYGSRLIHSRQYFESL